MVNGIGAGLAETTCRLCAIQMNSTTGAAEHATCVIHRVYPPFCMREHEERVPLSSPNDEQEPNGELAVLRSRPEIVLPRLPDGHGRIKGARTPHHRLQNPLDDPARHGWCDRIAQLSYLFTATPQHLIRGRKTHHQLNLGRRQHPKPAVRQIERLDASSCCCRQQTETIIGGEGATWLPRYIVDGA